MNCETKPRLPVVDLSSKNLKTGSESWNSACQDVRKALEEFGCLELVYSKPSLEFHNTILGSVDELFQLPHETKLKNKNPNLAQGYMRIKSDSLIDERMGFGNPADEQECQNFTNLMWPDGNPLFCESVHRYAKMVAELQELLVRMICESYGIEKECSESLINSTTCHMTFLKYRKSKLGISTGRKGHRDKSFLSILHQNHVNGLKIRTEHGDWIPYSPTSHSSFVVFAGDACMAWSNDRIKSCFHQVEVEGVEVRYALGLFSFVKGWIKAPKELVNEEYPLKYKPFEHQALLDFYQAKYDPNKADSNIVNDFCGI